VRFFFGAASFFGAACFFDSCCAGFCACAGLLLLLGLFFLGHDLQVHLLAVRLEHAHLAAVVELLDACPVGLLGRGVEQRDVGNVDRQVLGRRYRR